MANFEMLWSAPEFEYREKDVSWYWISIIVASLMVAFAAWQRNFLFGFFIVVAEILFVLWGNETPREITFALTNKSLEIGDHKFYTLSSLESVGIDELDEAWTELVFSFKAKLKTPIKILFPTHRLEELKKNLKGVLKEIDYQPTLLDSLEKLIRF